MSQGEVWIESYGLFGIGLRIPVLFQVVTGTAQQIARTQISIISFEALCRRNGKRLLLLLGRQFSFDGGDDVARNFRLDIEQIVDRHLAIEGLGLKVLVSRDVD